MEIILISLRELPKPNVPCVLSPFTSFQALVPVNFQLKVAVCLYPLETVVFAVCVTDVTAMTSKLQ